MQGAKEKGGKASRQLERLITAIACCANNAFFALEFCPETNRVIAVEDLAYEMENARSLEQRKRSSSDTVLDEDLVF